MLVGISVAVSGDFGVGAVGIHADGEAGSPDVTVIGFLAGAGAVIDEKFSAAAFISAAHVESLAGLVFEDRATVSIVEIELSVGSAGDGVERVIVVACVEPGEDNFAFVDLGIEFQVVIDIGVFNQIGRLGNPDFISENGHAKWSNEAFFLDEGVGGIAFSVTIGVLKDRDAVTSGPSSVVASVVDALGHPDSTGVVDVHVGGVVEIWGGGPD